MNSRLSCISSVAYRFISFEFCQLLEIHRIVIATWLWNHRWMPRVSNDKNARPKSNISSLFNRNNEKLKCKSELLTLSIYLLWRCRKSPTQLTSLQLECISQRFLSVRKVLIRVRQVIAVRPAIFCYQRKREEPHVPRPWINRTKPREASLILCQNTKRIAIRFSICSPCHCRFEFWQFSSWVKSSFRRWGDLWRPRCCDAILWFKSDKTDDSYRCPDKAFAYR
jgi:hypothetical protein